MNFSPSNWNSSHGLFVIVSILIFSFVLGTHCLGFICHQIRFIQDVADWHIRSNDVIRTRWDNNIFCFPATKSSESQLTQRRDSGLYTFREFNTFIRKLAARALLPRHVPEISGVIVLPRKSISVSPKWHLCIVNFNPASLMHSNEARRFLIKCSASFAAMPMSSTYCAHWSALITRSKYSLIKLEKADRAQLSPWANLL